MKLYKISMLAYDYWYNMDGEGFTYEEKYFCNKNNALIWIKENPNYIYRGFDEKHTQAEHEYQKPKNIQIIEIETED